MAIYYNNPRDLGNPMAQAGIAPPLYQRSPYATATVMAHPVMQAGNRGYYPPTGGAYPQYPYGAPYGPSVGFGVGTAPTWSVTPLTGYPSAYPHVLNGAVMAGEPFRMTQYFGPAYMPGFMDMMMARMLQGMMGGGRRGGGGGGAAPQKREPAPAMDIDWAPCAKGGCSGAAAGPGAYGRLPRVDAPTGVDLGVAPTAGASIYRAPVSNAEAVNPTSARGMALLNEALNNGRPVYREPVSNAESVDPNSPRGMALLNEALNDGRPMIPDVPMVPVYRAPVSNRTLALSPETGSWQLPIELEAPFIPFRR